MTGRGKAVGVAVLAGAVLLLVWRSLGPGSEEETVATEVAVHVGEVGRATLHRTVTAYGRVEPEPAGNGRPAGGALLTPFVDGVLASIEGVEGRPVAKGAILFRLDSRQAEVAVQRASQAADFAAQAFRRQEELVSSDGTSQRAFLEARQALDAARSELAAAETDLAYLSIASPLDGTVVRMNAELGQRVDATTVLGQVVDLSRLVVTAAVPAREITGMAVAQRVLLGDVDSGLEGTVTVLGKDVDLATGTYRVQASIPAGAGFLPGQFTDIRIVVEERADVLVVPEGSLVTRPGEGSWISVVEGDRAVRRAVTPGLRERGLVEVSGEGIAEGMTIVTDAAYSLPEETAILIVGG